MLLAYFKYDDNGFDGSSSGNSPFEIAKARASSFSCSYFSLYVFASKAYASLSSSDNSFQASLRPLKLHASFFLFSKSFTYIS